MTTSLAGERPFATIVTTSDYKADGDETWEELRLTLEGLARQDWREPVEFLLVEAADRSPAIPPDIPQILPGLRIVGSDGETSYDLKNDGARAAASDFVVLLDADCAPHPDWWRSLREHRRRHPAAAVISGRTLYKGDGMLSRIFGLLDRSFVDSGRAGPTNAISTNNAGFQRAILLEHPFRNDVGPFGAKPYADRILAAGGELRFEPEMIAHHGLDGWPMMRTSRELTGFAMARYRQLNPDARHAWMFRLSYLGIALMVAMSIVDSWRRCFRLGAHYGVRWFELPVALAVAVRLHLMDIPGMRLALHGGRIGDPREGWR